MDLRPVVDEAHSRHEPDAFDGGTWRSMTRRGDEISDTDGDETESGGRTENAPNGSELRDESADRRDLAAEERDIQANVRDNAAFVADAAERPSSHLPAGRQWERRSARERQLSAGDRVDSAMDRKRAAGDRESARHDLVNAEIDHLTGSMGRGAGLAAVRREMDRSERTGEQLVLAFVDVVGLKAINDTKGHAAGDRVLQAIATTIREDIRPYDFLVRLSGDEFICPHPGQYADQVHARYEHLSLLLAKAVSGARMTVGLATRRPGDSVDDLVERADQAMMADRRST
jgi:diguanylate cyclase (GGDEF)-like protein